MDELHEELERRIEEMGDQDPSPPHDEKYIVFKREDFFQMMGTLALPPWRDEVTGEKVGEQMDCAPLAQNIIASAERLCLDDAVVIRRQDYFASPALATYASMIGMANMLATNPELKERLTKVADYFQRQSEMAADQGWKFPD